ncbi:sporulation delaying protein family toxin [Streptomyces avermitilis]|uniref:sporulation delaying protein family toxin n=1 Tax=Streptomyces avermitilis TaxID=33903 RepID=UPI0033A68260
MNIKQRGILVAAGITAAALCVSVAPSAMADSPGTSTKPAAAVSAASAKTDGENVFRGLFFGQGKVGRELAVLDLFSEARQYIDNDSPDEIRASNIVVELINKRAPGFFADLSTTARSGDPRQVEKAVTDAQNMLLTVAKSTSAKPAEDGQLCGVTVAVAAAVVHVAAVITAAGAVITVTVAAGANFVKGKNWFWSADPTSGDGTPLSQDEAVAQVTQALKTA